MKYLIGFIFNKISNEDGQAMTEYVLIIILIAIVVVSVLTGIGNHLVIKFNDISSKFGGSS